MSPVTHVLKCPLPLVGGVLYYCYFRELEILHRRFVVDPDENILMVITFKNQTDWVKVLKIIKEFPGTEIVEL